MRLSRPKPKVRGLDLTPMIDVVLQLIIFFMFTSQFAQIARTPVDLPEESGDKESVKAESTVTVDIDADGEMLVESRVVDMDELVRIVTSEIESAGGDGSQVTVLLRSDRDLPAIHLNAVALRLNRLGIRGWKLGTAAPAGGTP